MAEAAGSLRAALALQIVESVPDALIAFDARFRVTFANESAERLLGRREGDLLGRPPEEVIPAGSQLEAALRRALQERPAATETHEERPEKWYEARASTASNGGLVLRFHDVTGRKLAENALRAERKRFRDVLDQLPAYLILLSPDYHVPFANRFFRQRFGDSHGRRCFEYLFERTEPCENCQTYKVLETKAPRRWQWKGPDGCDYDIYDFPFPDSDGSPLIMEVGLDVTERLRAEAELAKHRDHLEEEVRERTRQLEEANARLQEEIAERKRAEQRLTATLESIGDGFFACDEEWRFVYINAAAERLLGVGRGELMGKIFWDVYSATLGTTLEREFRLAAGGESRDFENFYEPWSRWFHNRCFPRQGGGLAVYFEDITERKRSEEELARTHARLEAVMQAVPVGVSFSDDPTCRQITGNPAVLAQFEAGPQDNLSASAPDATAPGRRLRYYRDGKEIGEAELPLQRAVREGCAIPPMELEVRLPSGRRWFADASGAPIRDREGNLLGGVAVTVDITARRQAEEELRRSREWLRVTLSSIGDAVLAADTAGKITFVNPVAVALTGWTETECLGQPIERVFNVINEDTRQPATDAAAEALRTRCPVALANHTALMARDGRQIPIEDSAAPILDGAGNVAGVVIVFHDVSGQRRAQAALAAAQAEAVNERNRLRAVMEALPVGVALFDLQGGYLESNPGYDKVWGASRPPTRSVADYAAYKGWWSATGQPVRPEEWGSARASLQGETVVGQEIDIQRFDGTRASVFNSAAPVRDAAGQISGSAVAIVDISELRRTQQKLRESELRLRTLADNLPEAAIYRYRVDAGGAPHIDFVTAGIERLTGVPVAEYMSDATAVERSFVPEDRERLNRGIQASRESLRLFEEELRHQHRVTGEVRWSLLRATPTHNLDGSTTWDGIELDITARKRAEEAASESRARLEAALASMTDAVFISDAQGQFIDFNDAFATFHRFRSKAECATTFAEYPGIQEVFLPGGTPAPLDMWAVPRALRGETATNAEYTLRRKDTGETWVGSYSFGPIRDRGGAIVGSVVVARDITDLKAAEERLRQSQKLESIGLLAGGVAHDFNNLLVGVIGNASLAQDILPEGHEVAEILGRIVKAGEQAAHLTRQMLAYAGKGQFLIEAIDLSDLIPEISGLVQPSISKKVAMQLTLEPNLPAVEADRGQMQQVFMNLVLNAAEAIGSNAGLISVRTGAQTVDAAYQRRFPETAELAPGTYVYLEVRDTGCGMDEATRARVFDPFFSTKFQGRGLGLAAVAGIVRAHKGAIQVTTAPGAGAIFRVLFPVSNTSAAASEPPAGTRRDLRGKGTVLVVDDEQHVLSLAQAGLERHGYHVLLAESGPAAIEIIREQGGRIDLVVLDLGMPVMGGEEVLPRLREIRPDLKVMVSSGFSETETLRAFAGAPLSGFIQKPYTVRELAAEVKAAMA
jgi:two-component system cell cycle sensor histidine kinase/response regulator CckA